MNTLPSTSRNERARLRRDWINATWKANQSSHDWTQTEWVNGLKAAGLVAPTTYAWDCYVVRRHIEILKGQKP